MPKYLYGASVQGIQSFIFQTNKLAEIVGASELVESICTTLFKKNAPNFKEENKIIGAAGNIKYLFETKEDCEALVLKFPKMVMETAPGITISQAVVEIKEDIKLSDAIDCLEIKLKTQRNKLTMPTEIGFMGLERSRRTGGVGIRYEANEVIDSATDAKDQAKDNLAIFKKMAGEDFAIKTKNIALNIEDITKSGNNSWIAVIHADGNGVGNILQNMGKELKESSADETQKAFSSFSKALDTATKAAIQSAFKTIPQIGEPTKNGKKTVERYPIRPIIIGGDDVTVIVRADLALAFTEKFLAEFEIETEKAFTFLKDFKIDGFEKGITACAGIAFVKESYPFHYAVHLAEALCKDAKKMVKEGKNGIIPTKIGTIPQSSIAFYKVQETFVEDLETMKKRTMETDNVNFYFGPYLLQPEGNFANLEDLKEKLGIIKAKAVPNEKSKAVGKLRQIVSEMYRDPATATFMLERMKEIDNTFYHALKLDNEKAELEKSKGTSILNDLIQLHGFNYGNNDN